VIGLAQIPVPARHARLGNFVIDALAACAVPGPPSSSENSGRPGTTGLRCPGIAWGPN